MAWISVEREGWAGFIVIRSSVADTRRYFGYSKRDAERKYREEFGLKNWKLDRIHIN